MAKLIYITPTSLDGYIADDGNFDWSAPDDAAFAFINDVLRPIGTYLYGRRTYETMAAIRDLKAQSPHDISVGGPTLAAHAIRAGLVDEYHLFVVPVIRGGGKRVLPDGVSVKLDLLEERGLRIDESVF